MSVEVVILICRRRLRENGLWRRGCRASEMALSVVDWEEFDSLLMSWFDLGMCKSVGGI